MSASILKLQCNQGKAKDMPRPFLVSGLVTREVFPQFFKSTTISMSWSILDPVTKVSAQGKQNVFLSSPKRELSQL